MKKGTTKKSALEWLNKRCTVQSTLCVANKKGKTELKAMSSQFFFFFVKRAGRHFGFFKRAGRHEKGAGRRALQKKPRQNTVISPRTSKLSKELARLASKH